MTKILVVDPMTATLVDLERVLRAKGHDVRSASSGDLGVQLFRQFNPDVTIVNPALDDISGTEFLRRLKGCRPDAAIILYVDERNPPQHLAVSPHEVAAIVKKEFSLHGLGAALTAVLGSATGTGKVDRRDGERFEVLVMADVTRDAATQAKPEPSGLILDLSTSGCRVSGVPLVKKGDYISLLVKLGGQSEPVNVQLASVRWVSEKDFGVEFIRLSQRDQQRLRDHVEVSGSYRVLASDPPVMEMESGRTVVGARGHYF